MLTALAAAAAAILMSCDPPSPSQNQGTNQHAEQPAQEAPAHDARLAPFASLASTWTTPADDGAPMQESWLAPRGNNMTGVLRWFADDGSVRMYEVMTITAEADAVRLRIRHFDKDMNPWASESEGPMVLILTESSNGRHVFSPESRARSLASLTYDLSGEDRMTVELTYQGDRPMTKIGFERVQD